MIHWINPLEDPRWAEFVERHSRASVFHTQGWLEALQRTYGYKPVVITTNPPNEQLTNGLVFCRIVSWLTGRRLVSLPFSDHCEPLVNSAENLRLLLLSLQGTIEKENWKCIEIRPLSSNVEGESAFGKLKTYCFHTLDLRRDLDEIFRTFHRSCVQRKIRRAEREGLEYQTGRCEELLRKFYHLLLVTRRRHQLMPQPLDWFRNLVNCLREKLTIHVASKGGQPIASIVTLRHKDTVVYKYGCSDANFNRLGSMAFLFWQTIQEAKRDGIQMFDLGRSDCENAGLVAFKDRWGATRSLSTYLQHPPGVVLAGSRGWRTRVSKEILKRLPDSLLSLTGELFYRHIG